MQYVIRRNKEKALPVWVSGIGRWWGSNPALKRQEEIDFVAAFDKGAIFGECKWRNEATGKEVLDSLRERSKLLGRYEEKRYMVFSKSGFSAGLKAAAKEHSNVELVDLDALFLLSGTLG